MYSVTVQTNEEEIVREYETLDTLVKVIDCFGYKSSSSLIAVADNPIVIVNSDNIRKITINASSEDILNFRTERAKEAYAKTVQEKSEAAPHYIGDRYAGAGRII